MLRICIIDDELIQLEYVQSLIDKWSLDNNQKYSITKYSSSEEALFENPQSFPFDFRILDIQMKELSGIELARKIRGYDQKIIIAFLTGTSDYIFDGYEVEAIRYLMKPVKEAELFALLNLVQSKTTKLPTYLILTVDKEKIKIDINDIYYVESMGHYVIIHSKDKEYQVKTTIKELSNELGNKFIFSHRSFLINLSHVASIRKDNVILENSILIPISRNLYKEVNESFISYFKGGQ